MNYIDDPVTYEGMTGAQRDAIRAIVRVASGLMLDAHVRIPNTANGREAKALLIEANDLLMDLHTALKGETK